VLTVYKRGKVYWLRGSIDGKRIRPRSLDTRDRQIADHRRRLAEREAMSANVRVAWSTLAEAFLKQTCDPATGRKPGTQVKYRFVVRRFSRFLQGRFLVKLEDITPEVIGDYTTERGKDIHPTKETHVGPEGIKSDLRILGAVFSFAVKRHWLKESPIEGKSLNARVRDTQPFSQDEVSRMLAAARKPDKRTRPDMPAILLTFLTTGFRLSDVVGLLKSDIDLGADHIIRRTKKRGKIVSLELHPELKAELVRAIPQTPAQAASPYQFFTRQGKPLQNLDGMLRALWRRCGVQGGHAHRFRDTFSVRMLEKSATLYDVAQYLGITLRVCERHYAPYVKELRDRNGRFVRGLTFSNMKPVCTSGVQSSEATL
jgi:integrase